MTTTSAIGVHAAVSLAETDDSIHAASGNLLGWVGVEAGQAAKNLVIVFLIRG
jgi:hypothetical protein